MARSKFAINEMDDQVDLTMQFFGQNMRKRKHGPKERRARTNIFRLRTLLRRVGQDLQPRMTLVNIPKTPPTAVAKGRVKKAKAARGRPMTATLSADEGPFRESDTVWGRFSSGQPIFGRSEKSDYFLESGCLIKKLDSDTWLATFASGDEKVAQEDILPIEVLGKGTRALASGSNPREVIITGYRFTPSEDVEYNTSCSLTGRTIRCTRMDLKIRPDQFRTLKLKWFGLQEEPKPAPTPPPTSNKFGRTLSGILVSNRRVPTPNRKSVHFGSVETRYYLVSDSSENSDSNRDDSSSSNSSTANSTKKPK